LASCARRSGLMPGDEKNCTEKQIRAFQAGRKIGFEPGTWDDACLCNERPANGSLLKNKSECFKQVGRSGSNLEPGSMRVFITKRPANGSLLKHIRVVQAGRKVGFEPDTWDDACLRNERPAKWLAHWWEGRSLPWKPETVGVG